jgi:hypothetical protein
MTIAPDSVLRRFAFMRSRLGGQTGGEEGGQGQEGEEHVHQRRGRQRWRRQGRERGRLSNDLSKAKPEMFDAWIEKGRTVRTVDTTLKWEAESAVVSLVY